MIKECNVISQNSKIAIVLYEDKEIQIPSNLVSENKAYIEYKNKKYAISSKDAYVKQSVKPHRNRTKIKREIDNED